MKVLACCTPVEAAPHLVDAYVSVMKLLAGMCACGTPAEVAEFRRAAMGTRGVEGVVDTPLVFLPRPRDALVGSLCSVDRAALMGIRPHYDGDDVFFWLVLYHP